MEVFSFKGFRYFYGMILKNSGQLLQPARRIISLVPSQTELLHYFGLEIETIGITKFCLHPDQWYRNKIRVGGTKTIDIQKITKLYPDLIIANKEENVQNQIEELATRFPVWVTDVNNLGEAKQMMVDIGQLTNKQEEARLLVQDIEHCFSSLNHLPPIPACYLIWKDPYMTVGSNTFINAMMERAGFQNVFSEKTRYPELNLDDIRTANPDLVLLSSEPYPFMQKHIEQMQLKLPGIKLMLVDGEMFSWYGSRLLLAPPYFKKIFSEAKALLRLG